MAKAKLVCGDCGNELSPGIQFCPKCGARIEGEAPSHQTESMRSSLTCEICGHLNTHTGAYCEACGAKLPGRKVTDDSTGQETSKPTAQKRKRTQEKAEPFSFQAWHYAAAAVVIGLLGFFVYLEVRRETGVSTPLTRPTEQSAQTSHEPPKEILEAIQRLEQQVKENPGNAGAKLLLANALHDAAMHNPQWLPRAIEAYRTYLNTTPNDPNARVDLGICYFELGKLDTTRSGSLFSMAINEMESAMKTSPTHQPGAFNLGIVYLYAGNLKESNKWFKKAIELNPESDLGKRAKDILDQHAQAGL
jgi:tetratricopeptide (TPR) repeat protein